MPIYGYWCNKCDNEVESFHGMLDNPVIVCTECGCQRIKLIGNGKFISGMNGGRATYDFVDYHTTGKPVRIHSKRQWQQHLKRYGLNDDVPNDTKSLKLKEGRQVDKAKMKRETKEEIVKAVKDKKHIREVKMKQKYLKKGVQ